jgi:hypothetical protein
MLILGIIYDELSCISIVKNVIAYPHGASFLSESAWLNLHAIRNPIDFPLEVIDSLLIFLTGVILGISTI